MTFIKCACQISFFEVGPIYHVNTKLPSFTVCIKLTFMKLKVDLCINNWNKHYQINTFSTKHILMYTSNVPTLDNILNYTLPKGTDIYDLCNIEPGDMEGNVKETWNTVAFIWELHHGLNSGLKQRLYVYWTIKSSISHFRFILFHSFPFFSN